jgi:hypothetical protein
MEHSKAWEVPPSIKHKEYRMQVAWDKAAKPFTLQERLREGL